MDFFFFFFFYLEGMLSEAKHPEKVLNDKRNVRCIAFPLLPNGICLAEQDVPRYGTYRAFIIIAIELKTVQLVNNVCTAYTMHTCENDIITNL